AKGREAPAAHGGEASHEGEEEGHEAGHGARHEERRLSAVGVRLGAPHLRLSAFAEWRDGEPDAQPVLPADEVLLLLDGVVAPLVQVLRGISALVLLVGGLGILVGLYNTLQGRRREIAILRALGARPAHVFGLIVLEGTVLCVLGAALGLVLGHLLLAALAPWALASYGVRLEVAPGALDGVLLAGVAVLGALAGLLPAWRGYRTPVATNLSPGA
ncbi:MAG: ABC transporter permease, partial [Planctomycetia bacterium]